MSLNKSYDANKTSYGQLFPKDNRFKNPKVTVSDTFCYDLPDLKNKRAPGFGQGSKLALLNKSLSNLCTSPTSQNIKSAFDTTNPQSKIYSFGASRDCQKKVYQEDNNKPDSASPGPCAYNIKNLTDHTFAYSIRPKLSNDNILSKTSVFPGPGTQLYTDSINKEGKYLSSKHKSTKAVKFNPCKVKLEKIKQSIGPGHYNPRTSMSTTGQQFLSGNKNINSCKFVPLPNKPIKSISSDFDFNKNKNKPRLSLLATDDQILSSYKNVQGSSFTKQGKRFDANKLVTPAPGNAHYKSDLSDAQRSKKN